MRLLKIGRALIALGIVGNRARIPPTSSYQDLTIRKDVHRVAGARHRHRGKGRPGVGDGIVALDFFTSRSTRD